MVEILSPSTAKQDKTTKKEDYALHGIKEYWIINPEKQEIEQYLLPTGGTSYFPAKTHKRSQNIKSKAIVGFEIDAAAIFDKTENRKAMQLLLAI